MLTNTSTVGLKEDEIELELGLSIGGGYQRPEKLKPIEKELVQVQQTSNSNSDGSVADPCEKNYRDCHNNLQSCTRSSVSPSFIKDAEQEIDLHVKREIQAARRHEVMKKREEKQQKRRMCKGQNGDDVNEVGIREWQRKRNKVGDDVAGSGSNEDEIKNVNGKLTGEQNRDYNVFSNPMTYIASPMCPAMTMQNQLSPLQCVPATNGFAYPYMMPCWAQSRASVGSERNVIRPMANPSAGVVQPMLESVRSLSMCSTSTVSENHSSSQQGGSSSDTRGHSNASLSEQNHKDGTKERAQDCESAHLLESAESINKSTNDINPVASNAIESSPTKHKEEPIFETTFNANQSRNLISTPETTPAANTFRETKGNIGKPPKPVNSNPNTTTTTTTITTLPPMPCVSTTGNGPNGKTINGFLYRYTKSEVSIVCVCHGTTFSPAEFVEHAGGTDLSQPLRHITVIPSAF